MKLRSIMRVPAEILAMALLATGTARAADEGIPLERAQLLSTFGERAAFSPDGTRVAFVGKSYGDAYEIELATGRIRNLTRDVPHQGILRVQYLPNGDYLLIGPKRFIGPNSRLNVDLYVLGKDLNGGLQPLDQGVVEGVAIGPRGLVAWQQIPVGTKLAPGESWMQAMGRVAFETYVGRIDQQGGRARLVEKRRIMDPRPEGCGFAEVQDFRQDGNEVISYCAGLDPAGKRFMAAIGYDLRTGRYTTFLKTTDYAEIEGISPDGRWSTVECGKYTTGVREAVPPLDICRLELIPGGRLTPLVIGTAPGTTQKISNSVVSPDGRSIAFQAADSAIGEAGEGSGIYLLRLND